MKRSFDTTYRCEPVNYFAGGKPWWEVTIYPPADQAGITRHRYKFEALPDWMREGVQLLDFAGGNIEIESLRVKRVGDKYWFLGVDGEVTMTLYSRV